MNVDRLLLFLLAAVCALASARVAASDLVPWCAGLFAAAALVAGPFPRFSGDLPRRAAIFAAASCLARFLIAPVEVEAGDGFFLFPLANAISDFCLVALCGLLARPDGERFRGFALLCAALSIGASGDVVVSNWRRYDEAYRLFSLAAVALSVAYAGRDARGGGRVPRAARPRIAEACLLALALLLSVPADALFLRLFPDLERLYNALFNPDGGRGAGFAGQVALGDIENVRAADAYVALRVESRAAPGYLRGRALPDFNGMYWDMGQSRETLAGVPLPAVSGAPARFRHFLLPAAEPDPGRATRIHPALEDRTIFLPEGAVALDACVAELIVDSLLQPRFSRDADLSDWIAHPARAGSGAAPPPVPAELARCLEIHRHARTVAVEFAARAFAGLSGTREILAAAGNFLEREGYRYARGLKVPTGARPLEWFLRESRRGHCEYFATAACLMLRARGIPARLAAGFLVSEKNPLGGYYVARNGDAHAWVEAFDGTRWTVVEATPGDGLPRGGGVGRIAAFLDHARFRLSRFRNDLRFGGVAALARFAGGALLLTLRLLRAALPYALAALLAAALLRRIRGRGRAGREMPVTSLGRLLQEADRSAARAGLPRRPAETALEFADRAEGGALPEADRLRLARWYRAWSAARWGGAEKDLPPL